MATSLLSIISFSLCRILSLSVDLLNGCYNTSDRYDVELYYFFSNIRQNLSSEEKEAGGNVIMIAGEIIIRIIEYIVLLYLHNTH